MAYTILIVDDDSEFREELRDFLSDYKVFQASNGQEALKLLRKPNEIDLVLLDVKMPGEEGTEVLKEIKKISSALSIVIMTGYGSKNIVIEALKGHADDYIEKPFDIDKLKKAIEKILTNKEGEINNMGIKGKIERVKQFTQRNYQKKINLKDAALVVCLSPKYLSRIFKENTGKTFSQYKSEFKIKKAKGLLKKTNYTINQIADKLGYENTESFIRVFKKIYERTPIEYKQAKR